MKRISILALLVLLPFVAGAYPWYGYGGWGGYHYGRHWYGYGYGYGYYSSGLANACAITGIVANTAVALNAISSMNQPRVVVVQQPSYAQPVYVQPQTVQVQQPYVIQQAYPVQPYVTSPVVVQPAPIVVTPRW